MTESSLVAQVCERLRVEIGAHTILLYGSRASGTADRDSDYDIAAFGPIERTWRDARIVDGQYLDVFVYPESVLAAPAEDHLRLRSSRIVLQRGDEASRFLEALDALHARGPAPLPDDEIAALVKHVVASVGASRIQ